MTTKKNCDFLKYICLIYVFSFNFAIANDIQFEAKEILTYENGKVIVGRDNAEVKINEEIKIFANKYTYNKDKKLIIIENDVEVLDLKNKVKLNSQLIHYEITKEKIISFGETVVDVNNKYIINAENIKYLHPSRIIYSDKPASLIDSTNNTLKSSKFKYFLNDETYKGINIELHDNEKNKYFLSDGIVKLRENIILGRDIKVLLRNDSFDNPENEPQLKGNSVSYRNNLTVVKKGIFTSCKNTGNCPPWSITSKEIVHDKINKTINYKDAWLRLYDKPILYFPKFFHPDPTVKRKSGFLIPSFGNSKNLGGSVIVPYFHAISDSADMTVKPRIFTQNKFLVQSEYRKVTKNSSHIFDLSINRDKKNDKNGRKTHFFSNSKFDLDTSYFDESNIFINVEKSSNDGYLELYSLEDTNSIVKETDVLESSIEYSGNKDELFFDFSIESYETQNKANSDRYEFIYPNYFITNSFDSNYNLIRNFVFSSRGNQKKFSTNVYEGVQINDLVTSSNEFINNYGLLHNFEIFLKNVNSVGKNSEKFKDDEQSEVLSIVRYDFNLPLIKDANNYKNILTPKLSFRHSPNSSKNNKDQERFLNIGNIFSSNRIGFEDSVEGGSSLTIGVDFDKKDNNNNSILSSSIATVFREKINLNLPTSSTLGEKQSDFVGNISFIPSNKISFDYDYSVDSDLDEVNLHKLKNTLKVNNFVNEFIFYEENNLIGKKSFFENEITYNYNDANKFSFKTRENKKENLTEFYNLIYQYETDCLIASVIYNKEYYSNNSNKPNEDLFFNITLIPLGSTKTDNIIDTSK
jgi:LPS-assembly protein